MHLAIGQLPNQPSLDGAEQELAGFCLLSGARDIFENPAQLRAAEIGIDQKSCLLTNHIAVPGRFQLIAVLRGTAALPHNRVADRNAGFFIPNHRRLSLIGNADGFNVFVCAVDLKQRLLRHAHLRRPNFHRIMLDPPCPRIDLRKFLLRDTDHIAFAVVQNTAGARRSLIQCHDIFFHSVFLPARPRYTNNSIIRFEMFIPLRVRRMPASSSSAQPVRTNSR